MRNASGLMRSAEYLKANPEQAPELHHMRIHPHKDGVRVTHHASASAKPHADHHFSHGDSEGLMEHISTHAGFEERPDHAAAVEPDEE